MKKAYEKPLAKKGQSLQSITAGGKCLPTSIGEICLPSNGLLPNGSGV